MFSVITEGGTVWERIEKAIHAYRERFGRKPYEVHVDADLLPFEFEGIYALYDCEDGEVRLAHEPISGHCRVCDKGFVTDSGSYPRGYKITGNICMACARYGQPMT